MLPTLDFSAVADGIYQVRLTARDVANNNSPQTTTSWVTVDLDRQAPSVSITYPASSPFLIDGTNPPSPIPGDQWALQGIASDDRRQGTTVAITVYTTASVSPVINTTVPSQAITGVFVRPMDFVPGHGIVLPTTPPQDIYRIDVRAQDLAGNWGPTVYTYVIRDVSAPRVPAVTFPADGLATSAPILPIRGRITNLRPGENNFEEHGRVRVRVSIQSQVRPGSNAVVELDATPSGAVHDSTLDDAPPWFSQPTPDILGDIPDYFSFDTAFNLTSFPTGNVTVSAQAVDQVGNRSAWSPAIRFFYGPAGPRSTIDWARSGPDDNYQFIGLRTNQYGADDGDADGVPGFFISLKSPEMLDVGDPPSAPRPPFFNGRRDPPGADLNIVTLSVTSSDIATPVDEVVATGTDIPTVTVTQTGLQTTVVTDLRLDVSRLPEGLPSVVVVRATNSDGTSGQTT
ncbi:MAG: hypothetical protein HY815_24155, partial [Candidatus Riflebacteria bacterium]|nr:hypothetical protein [Candidatus Riflebacteria bacterium]